MIDIGERLRRFSERADADDHFLLLEAADEIERLRSQLPDGMKHCTIQFKECEKGHGRLTATNWIDHGCPQCEIERLRNALQNLVADVLDYERVNNLAPNPGKQDCWQSITQARAALEQKP